MFVRVGLRDAHQHHLTPPIGLMYLAAYARERFETEISILDQRLENCTTDEVAKAAEQFEADIVGLSCTTPSAYLLRDIGKKVREARPSALIALGGPHVSGFRERALTSASADVAVLGEGEVYLEKIIEAYLDSKDYSGIPGLIWRDGEDVVTNPGKLPYIEDLDTLPMPAYDLVDVRRYWPHYSFVLLPNRKYISLMTSRGCPYHCNYCHKVFGRRFRGHSAARIVDEIEYHVRKYEVDEVELLDDVFNYDHDRAMETCELLQKKDIKMKLALPNGVRSDTLSEELVDALVDAKLYFASFALESGSPRIQKHMGKRLHIPSFVKMCEYAVKKGVWANGLAMLGFPTETKEEMQTTVDVLHESRSLTGHFHTVTPFPGTELYENVLRDTPELLADFDFEDITVYNIQLNLSAEPNEVLFNMQNKAYRRFYRKPQRIWDIMRLHPCPQYLPKYIPLFIQRITRG